jgi:hypothetical protein
MAVQQVTTGPTEGDLEAEIHGALKLAFPWLPPGSIQHQTTFSFSFVRPLSTSTARSGTKQRPVPTSCSATIASLSLKRAGVPLDSDDDAQGLSYARVLHPQPPLVVVTNGSDVRILETHSGQEWQPADNSSEGLSKLIKSAAAVASSDLKAAVSTLMGSDPQIWAQAVRRTTNQTIAELSADWSESLRPFVPAFLIPRAATRSVLDHLRTGRRFVLVEGSPLIGKSNVLRELVQETNKTANFVTLFIEADAGSGVIQGIADTLSTTLNWPVNKDEVRNWLVRLSHSGGPALILAIDGIAPKRDVFYQEIEDLSSPSFGPAVRLVVAVDDTVAQSLVVNSTGRKASPIGRRSVRVPVGPLDDEEFPDALKVLWDHRAGIMKGGDKAAEFRLPWVLRAIMGEIVTRPQYADESLAASIPPLLGLELIGHAREQHRTPRSQFDRDNAPTPRQRSRQAPVTVPMLPSINARALPAAKFVTQ